MSKYLLILLLTGCASAPQIKYRVVEVPQPPVIETPVRAADPGTPDGRARVIVEYIESLKAALLQAQQALDVYRKTP